MIKNKIPKQIHYIWLGSNELDNLSKKCIESWEKFLPDYEIKCWNDENSLEIINKNRYAKEALKAKKYAFVSDYLRLYVLYHFGGIYMDTDVQVTKNIDKFLIHSAFSSFQDEKNIPTALMGSEKHGIWVKELLEYYENKSFFNEDNKYDLTTNVTTITNISLEKFGLEKNGKYQVLKSDVHIYPREYFCPIDTINYRNNKFTNNTHAIHLYNGSWTPKYKRILSRIKKILGIDVEKILGKRIYEKMKRIGL